MESEDNVVYIDEYKRERWLHNLQVARNMAKLGIVKSSEDNLIIFPERSQDDLA